MELRDYQKDLINNIRQEFAKGRRRVCAVLGCGGGKSVIAGTIAMLTTGRNNRVLFIVHRKELCQQITGTFELCGVDFQLCTVGMAQTVCRRLGKIQKPALIIIDECHHALAGSYQKIMNYFPDARVLGFTATPWRMGRQATLGDVFDSLVESVSTQWLIDNKFLSPFRYFSMRVLSEDELGKVHKRNGEYSSAEVEQLMDRGAVFGDAVKNWQKIAAGKQTIVYCAGVANSKTTAEAFREAGIRAEHLDGSTPQVERERIVQGFREGSITVICNVDLFGEGFDVPDCECVVLLRPTMSLSLHIQQSMRSMRYKPDKTAIIIDHVGNFARHGLPNDFREWTLEASKGKQKAQDKKARPYRECTNCFAVFDKKYTMCPYCGTEISAEVKERERVEAEMVEIQQKEHLYGSVGGRDYQWLCHSFDDLVAFQKAKKYRFQWVLHKALEMHIPIPAKYSYMMTKMRYG